MPAIEIIGIPHSIYVRVVRMVCEEKGVPYTVTAEMPRGPKIKALHPFGRIPAMRHAEVTLFESKAIATYIDRSFPGPKLIPDDILPAAQVEQWVSACTTYILPRISGFVQCYAFPTGPGGTPDRAAIEAALPGMVECVTALNRAIGAKGFLVGGALTLADLYPLPALAYLKDVPEGAEAIERASNVNGFFKTHASRASLKNTVPPPIQDLRLIRESIS